MATTIETLRAEDYSRPYTWEATFVEYGDFFPAYAVGDTALTFDNATMEYGPRTFHFPQKVSRGKVINLEIYDVNDYRALGFLHDWMEDIEGLDYTIKLIGTPGCTRTLVLQRLNNQRNPTRFNERLLVIPEGDVQVNHTSDKGGQPLSLSLTLTVVGEL